jgi:hypothetical protein
MTGLRFIDRFQIATTGLFTVLGVAIFVRAALTQARFFAYVVGAAFLLLGLVRARLITRNLRTRGGRP